VSHSDSGRFHCSTPTL
ncbi:hypothetical protein M513_04338, partial [Trichuris suis]